MKIGLFDSGLGGLIITKSIINDFNTFVEKHILFAVLIYGGYVWFMTVILKNSFDIRSIVSHII